METLLAQATEETVLHAHLPTLVHGLEWLAAGIDLCAIAILVLGALRFVVGFVGAEMQAPEARKRGIGAARLTLGGYILAGLELFIVSDVIHTALSLAFADLVFLLLLVVIRSIISFFLDRELTEIRRDLQG